MGSIVIPDGWTYFDYLNAELAKLSRAVVKFQSYLDDWKELDDQTKTFIKNKTLQTFADSLVNLDDIKKYMETV